MNNQKNAAGSADKAPTTEQWRRLYNVAAELNTMAPWRALWDSDIVTIQMPDQEEPVFCCTMGRGGECCGIGVYPGFDAFSGLYRLMSEDGPEAGYMDTMELRCLTCHFGDREEIAPEDRAVMQSLGLKFRGRNQWIYFRAMEPGYYPWFLNAGQAVLLAGVLENLIMAYGYLLRGDIQVNFEAGETLLRFYSEEHGEWLNSAVPMPPLPERRQCLQIKDELLLARLKRQNALNIRLELDSFHVPIPIQEKKGDVPYLPRILLLADRDRDLLLDQYVAQPGEAPEQIVLGMLVNFVETQGRPAAVYIRDSRMADWLEHTCEKIGISLVVGKKMKVIDAFIEEISTN